MIALGLTVFNRRHLLALSAASLRSILPETCRLIVVNDGSTEFTPDALQALLPGACIHTNERNSGRADYAIAQLANLLVKEDVRYVALLDSDLIFHPIFFETLFAAMPLTDGYMSTFNADAHKPLSPERIAVPGIDNALIEKKVVGSAGTVWSRDFLARTLQAVPPSPTWDWDCAAHLRSQGKRVFSLERSVVQHLGFWVGQNSSAMSGDYGLGYPSLGPEQSSIVAEMLFLGAKAAFAHGLAEKNAAARTTTYVSANHFRPQGTFLGRSRLFALQEPLLLEADISIDEGYYYVIVDAAIRRSIFQPLGPAGAQLELALAVDGKTLARSSIGIKQLFGRGMARDALRLELDCRMTAKARLELRYRGPASKHQLHLDGILIDRK